MGNFTTAIGNIELIPVNNQLYIRVGNSQDPNLRFLISGKTLELKLKNRDGNNIELQWATATIEPSKDPYSMEYSKVKFWDIDKPSKGIPHVNTGDMYDNQNNLRAGLIIGTDDIRLGKGAHWENGWLLEENYTQYEFRLIIKTTHETSTPTSGTIEISYSLH